MKRLAWFLTLSCLFCPRVAEGQVTPIGPFVGDLSDNFDSMGLPFGSAHAALDIFGGFCTIRRIGTGSIKYEFDSNLGGDQVNCRSPFAMIGQLAISEWTFDQPISQFGGWWENNSRFDDAQVRFFDVNGNLIDEVTATVPKPAQAWTWNGWESATPISQIVVIGNDVGFLNGFIWYDDMELTVATAVPEPAGLALVAAGLGAVAYYRRCRRRTRR